MTQMPYLCLIFFVPPMVPQRLFGHIVLVAVIIASNRIRRAMRTDHDEDFEESAEDGQRG